MACRRFILCLALSLSSIGNALNAEEEKTEEGTLKAVAQAEGKAGEKAQDAKTEKQHVSTEEAAAVAKAAREVLTSEGKTNEDMPRKVNFQKVTLDRAEDTARKTFKELAGRGVDVKVAAAAAAESEVASVEGAVGEVEGGSDVSLANEVKLDAEKAGVAAGKAVADHPHDEALAMADAVKEVKKEDATGKADLEKAPAKGIVAQAAGVVSDLPSLAEDAVKDASSVAKGVPMLAYLSLLPFIGVGYLVWKSKDDNSDSPYINTLRQIRAEFGRGCSSDSHDKPFLATYQEMSNDFRNV